MAKFTEIAEDSTESFDDAVRRGLEAASRVQPVHDAKVTSFRARIEDGPVVYRVDMKIGWNAGG